jgi:hypothetical protein
MTKLTSKVSDDAVRERTGHGWQEWFARLDAVGATKRRHGEIVRWVMDDQGVDGWSAQTISVGYEQERGLREPGQNSSGSFSATVSRTVDVGVERAFAAVEDATTRAQWLPEDIKIRTRVTGRSVRADWADGTTRVGIFFDAKGGAKTRVSVMHEKVPDAAEAARLKAFWAERLRDLKALLES